MKFVHAILVTMSLAFSVQSHACEFVVYNSDTLNDSSWYNPNSCGAVSFSRKWSAACVNSYIGNAVWRQSIVYNGNAYRNTMFGGNLAYFLIEFDEASCNADFNVPTTDAILYGTAYSNGYKQKLYGVLDAWNNHNVLVALTRGISILRQ